MYDCAYKVFYSKKLTSIGSDPGDYTGLLCLGDRAAGKPNKRDNGRRLRMASAASLAEEP